MDIPWDIFSNEDVADLRSCNTLSDSRLHMDGLDDSAFVWPERESEIVAYMMRLMVPYGKI